MKATLARFGPRYQSVSALHSANDSIRKALARYFLTTSNMSGW